MRLQTWLYILAAHSADVILNIMELGRITVTGYRASRTLITLSQFFIPSFCFGRKY